MKSDPKSGLPADQHRTHTQATLLPAGTSVRGNDPRSVSLARTRIMNTGQPAREAKRKISIMVPPYFLEKSSSKVPGNISSAE